MADESGRACLPLTCRRHSKTKERLRRVGLTSRCLASLTHGLAQAAQRNLACCTLLTAAVRGKLPTRHSLPDNLLESSRSLFAMRSMESLPVGTTERNKKLSTIWQ